MDEALKRCAKCREQKPATGEFFGPRKTSKDGLYPYCRECKRADDKSRWPERKEASARVALERQEKADLLAKGLKKCTLCGEVKALEWFTPDRRRGGLLPECRPCKSARAAARLACSPVARDKARESQKRHRPKARAQYTSRLETDAEFAEKERVRKKESARRSRATDPERHKVIQKNYRLRHVEKVRAAWRSGASQQRSKRACAPGNFTGHDLSRILRQQQFHCFYCSKDVREGDRPWHADHFVPLSRGGTNYPENIVISCEACNLRKRNLLPHEFMPDRFPQPHPDQ